MDKPTKAQLDKAADMAIRFADMREDEIIAELGRALMLAERCGRDATQRHKRRSRGGPKAGDRVRT